MKRLFHPHFPAAVACLAGLACLAAVVGFSRLLPGYAHSLMPVAVLGAWGVPRAQAFNLLGFMLPGALMAWAALGVRSRLDTACDGNGGHAGVRGWPTRVGAGLWLLSSLAFAGQGLWPLDLHDLDGPTSQRHASLWTLWWIAFVPGALLLASGLWRRRRAASAWALATGVAVLVFAALPPSLLPGPVGQRVALLAWFAAYAAVARELR